jgi:excisionase family DNA binding protein
MKLLTTKEVGEILNLSKHTIWKMCRENRIPYIKISVRNYRISQEAVDNYIKSNTVN